MASASKPKDVTVESIVSHLNAESHFPNALDLDLKTVKMWIKALNTGLSRSAIKQMAPEVLSELRSMEGVSEEEATQFQAHYPVNHNMPVLTYVWKGNGAPPATSEEALVNQLQQTIPKTRVKKETTKTETTSEIGTEEDDNESAGGVKLEPFDSNEENEKMAKTLKKAKKDAKKARKRARALEEAMPPVGKRGLEAEENEKMAKALKKAKKDAKKARKRARALEEAMPPVGKRGLEAEEDDGYDSAWSQTSWNPSWASDLEEL